MSKVRVITLKEYSEQVLKTLHKVGVLHIERSEELAPVGREALEKQQKEVNELLTFVNDVLGYVTEKQEVLPKEDVEVIYTGPFGEINKEVRSLYVRFSEQHEKLVKTDEELKILTELKNYLGALTQQYDVRLRDLKFSGHYLFSRVLILPTEIYKTLQAELEEKLLESAVNVVDDETVVYAIGRVENLEALKSLIGSAGGKILPVPDKDLTLGEFIKKSGDELHRLEEKSAKFSQELQTKVKQELERLALLRGALVAERQRLRVLARAGETKYLTSIEGWAPESTVESIIAELKNTVDNVFIETRKPEPSEEPPTKMKNPTPLKPFQLVIKLFSTPGYREGDPTPIIAYSFAIFFGLMVADVVYAIGLMFLAKFILGRLLGGSKSEEFKLLQRLIYISSGVALTLGLLTGNYLGDIHLFFGIENMALSAGVQQLLSNPIKFVILAILIGWIHVNIAHIIALVRGVQQRNTGLVISKVGLLTIQFGAFWILRTVMGIDIPYVLSAIMPVPAVSPRVYGVAMYAAFIGIGMIIGGNFKERGGIGAILGVFDITGLLGDVMSYSRLAGVGLATFYLGSAFNMLAGVLSGMVSGMIGGGIAAAVGGTIVAIFIMLLGHTINLLLGFLTGFIHSLRLCFVEFLIKFFEGGGKYYSPFKLIKRRPVVVGAKS